MRSIRIYPESGKGIPRPALAHPHALGPVFALLTNPPSRQVEQSVAQAKGVLEAALRGETAKASPAYPEAMDVGGMESGGVNGEQRATAP